jgi:hypothetical protein
MRSFAAAVSAALCGVAFFFAIIGVFGFAASIAAVLVFVAIACLIVRRPQAGGMLR